jgi:hypothetical protein
MGVRLQVQTPTKTQKRFRRTPTIKAKNKQWNKKKGLFFTPSTIT